MSLATLAWERPFSRDRVKGAVGSTVTLSIQPVPGGLA